MKSFIISASMLTVILILWGCLYFYTDSTSEQLVSDVQVIYNEIHDEDWENAEIHTELFIKKLNDLGKYYSMYMEANEVQDIQLSAERCLGYVNAQSASMASGEAASIIKHLSLLTENHLFSLENLF